MEDGWAVGGRLNGHESLVGNLLPEDRLDDWTKFVDTARSPATLRLPRCRLASGLLPFVIACIYLTAYRMQLLIIVSPLMQPYTTRIHVCTIGYRLVCSFISKSYRLRRRYSPSTRL